MYKNLKAEMIKQDITVGNIAELLGIKKQTVQKKINGVIGLTLIECKKISSLFKTNNSLDYLFVR